MADLAGDLAVDIVTEVVAYAGTPATELEPPLGEVVDIDALAQLLDRTEPPIRVSFEYLGYEVTVLAEAGEPQVFVRQG